MNSSVSYFHISLIWYTQAKVFHKCYRWALIKDKDVYDKVSTYIKVADLGISKDSQLRALKLIKAVVGDDGKSFFEFGYNTMRDRWERLTLVFAKSSRFSIQQRNPLHCNFFHETRLPSPGNFISFV